MVKRKLDSERPCRHCGNSFKPRADLTKRGLGVYCSQRCNNSARRIVPNVSKEILEKLHNEERLGIHQIAKRLGYLWKPIYRKMKGYGMDTSHGALRHPETYEMCYRSMKLKERVAKHVLVAERKYSRILKTGEVVHHIDGNKQNNKPENLCILQKKRHGIYHRQLEVLAEQLYQKGAIQFNEECGYIISPKMGLVLDGITKQ